MTELPADLEALLVQQIADRKKSFRTAGLTGPAVFFPMGVLVYFFLDPPARNLWVMCLGAGLLGMLMLIPGLGDPRKAKVLQELRRRAQDVVWMYVRINQGNGAMSWVLVHLVDGKVLRLPTKNGSEGIVIEALARFLPHATTGFAPERAQAFKRDPKSLRLSGPA